MTYVDLFKKNIENFKLGKSTKLKYQRIKDFIKSEELAIKLDELKVPNWYILRFILSSDWQISFIERQITYEEKFSLFLKSLDEIIVTRDKEKTFLWKLKEWNYDTNDYIRKYTKSTITKEEQEKIIETAKKYRKKHEEELRKFRSEFGNLFDFSKLFNFKDDYKTLGLEKDCTKEEIKRAYRKLAKKNHPDLNGNVEKFREVNQAYERLILKYK